MHLIVLPLLLLATVSHESESNAWVLELLRAIAPQEAGKDQTPPRRPEEHPKFTEWKGVPREKGPPPRRPPEHPVFGDWRGPAEDPPASPMSPFD